MRLDARRCSLTCLYCKDDLADARTCHGCRAVYHDECLHDDLQGACATLGCEQVEASPTPTTLPPPRPPGRFTGPLSVLAVLLGVAAVAIATLLPSGAAQTTLAWTGAAATGLGLLVLASRLHAADPPRPEVPILHRAPIW